MSTRAQELRALIDEASAEAVVVRDVELELRGRRAVVRLVTPDLLTLQDVLDEARAEDPRGRAGDFNGRYLRKLVPRIAYADFDLDRMEGELLFPAGDQDPVYRRLMRHPAAFTALTVAAADVVRPLQAAAEAGSAAPSHG